MQIVSDMMKTYLYNFDPLKPCFYIVKLEFTGVYIIFLFLLKNIGCGYSLELPYWGGSKEYPQSMFRAEIWNISEFLSENFHFLVVKLSIYLEKHVFVMRRQFAWNVKIYYLEKIRKIFQNDICWNFFQAG